MRTFLHDKFQFTLYQYTKHNQRILIALSGGQDSLCLLKLLIDCINKKQQAIQAIYIDHQWKNNSKKHAQHMINIANFTQLPIAIYQAKRLPLSEKEGRVMRYKILLQHALKRNCSIIMTAHNNDDQAETLIGNLLRGTSINGIANFTAYKIISSQLSIMRPLIYFKKAEITWLCRLFYLPGWSDQTNHNLNLKRNRIRYELMPYIQNFFNPKIQETLGKFQQICREDNSYMQENTIKLYIKSKHARFISINLAALKKQHKALRKRVIKLYFYYHFHKQINSMIVEWVLSFDKKHKKTIILGQFNLHISNGWLNTTMKPLQ